ncbi:MAG: N-acetylmuramoyl-L-alanine amidase [Candidatus Absconditabacterales bacterium]|nr:N-acetylmuramoyl-L-alanine amidase [Candidatus Absconditabacterales bacterium]
MRSTSGPSLLTINSHLEHDTGQILFLSLSLGPMVRYLVGIITIFLWSYTFASTINQTWDLPGITLITRAEWGADERSRLRSHAIFQGIIRAYEERERQHALLRQTNFDAWLQEEQKRHEARKREDDRNAWLLQSFSEKFSINNRINNIFGEPLRWPQTYHFNKTEIIIHHTAGEVPTDQSITDEIAEIQRIYRFHTHSRARGDIGYNFIIGPSGRIYEGRAGGPGVIGAHAQYNNTTSIGISLMGNFEVQSVPQAQYDALVQLTTALARYYNINPNDQTTYFKAINNAPFIQQNRHFRIAGHRDAGWTSCPGKFLYEKLPTLRSQVLANLAGLGEPSGSTHPLQGTINPLTLSLKQKRELLQKTVRHVTQQQPLTPSTAQIQRNSTAPLITSLPDLIKKPVSVLLLEASTSLNNTRNISCSSCTLTINQSTLPAPRSFTIRYNPQRQRFLISQGSRQREISSLTITTNTQKERIIISNYGRTSFQGIPRHSFWGSMTFTIGQLPSNQPSGQQPLVINTLDLDRYLLGIVEANDQHGFEYNKIMAILARSYMLYYLDDRNRHPSIPANAPYNAIDDPDYFQKFVGAGVVDTLKLRPRAVADTQYTIMHINNRIVLFPYFSCTPGFTLPASFKWGWTDAPYLKMVLDPAPCNEFVGHGVGLSGQGARALLRMGVNYRDVLRYFYHGVQFTTTNLAMSQ